MIFNNNKYNNNNGGNMYIVYIILFIVLITLIIPIKVGIKYTEKSNQDIVRNKDDIKIYLYGFIKVKTIKFNNSSKNNDKDNNNKDNNKKLEKGKHENNKESKNNKITSKNQKKSKVNIAEVLFKVAKNYLNFRKKEDYVLTAKDIKLISNSIRFKRLYIDVGVNFNDMILNAYIVTFINTVVSMYIGKNIKRFNKSKLEYNVYISKKIVNFECDVVVTINPAILIYVLLKIFIKLKKLNKKEDNQKNKNR